MSKKLLIQLIENALKYGILGMAAAVTVGDAVCFQDYRAKKRKHIKELGE